MKDLQKLIIFYKNLHNVRTCQTLTNGEKFEIWHNKKQITDEIIFYNGKFYKIEEIRTAKKINLEYPIKNIKIKQCDLNEYKNNEKWYFKDYYNNEILPKLKKYNLEA